MVKKLLVIIVFFFGLFLSSYAQDPHFSQFYANPVYTNPAFAGAKICPRLTMNYRNQWPGVPGSFVTYNATYDQHIEAISGGLGIMAYQDQTGGGVLNETQLALAYSFKWDLNRKFSMRAGLQAAYFNRNLKGSLLTFGDEFDPKYGKIYPSEETKVDQSIQNVDFSAGVVGYSNNFWIGAAVHHLTQPNIGFLGHTNKLPMRYTAHSGFKIPIKTSLSKRRLKNNAASISPNILYMQQGGLQMLNYGLYYNLPPFIVGLWYRQSFTNPDALIFMFGFEQEAFKFGYSYDITVSELSGNTLGAHEVSFILNFPCRKKVKRHRAIECPSF